MEWFVCAVIGLNSKGSENNDSFWFDWDDVVVDEFGTARINLSASHSDSSPPHSPQSFSDGIASLSKLFLDLIHQLSKSDRRFSRSKRSSNNWRLRWMDQMRIRHRLHFHLPPSPHTSLAAHLNSSPRTHSSSPHFRQETLQLLDILHTLLTSPPPPSLHKQTLPELTPFDLSYHRISLIQPDPVNLNEKFDSSLFDEPDNEKLVRSLMRCLSVCQLVRVEECIRDYPEFVDRCVSVLHTTDPHVRSATFRLFQVFLHGMDTISLLPRWWNRLRSSFRDGQFEEQFCLIWFSTVWIGFSMKLGTLPPFPGKDFDWDGLIHASLIDDTSFILSIDLLEVLRHSTIQIMDTAAEVTDIGVAGKTWAGS
ncbi:hypothetical protein BLNAU_16101 [Blattamonas nauphoetae]|uniref:Uncharacterized protein n=1 Tax=Blattamonas nauphoetae TaxID=2049346 RepID=A0ABQ9XCC5_9EUKA|nr:hypothetical protein BLNAU_16101 [Blattamonas nauphoetae]